jgi:serine/threonine protein kinase
MPPEYYSRGQVSPRTDAFAFGIMGIELLTGLHPEEAREVVDDSLFETLPAFIGQHHNGEIDRPAFSAAAVKGRPPMPKCEWPDHLLQDVAKVMTKCVRKEPKLRSTTADLLPHLEQVVSTALEGCLLLPAATCHAQDRS